MVRPLHRSRSASPRGRRFGALVGLLGLLGLWLVLLCTTSGAVGDLAVAEASAPRVADAADPAEAISANPLRECGGERSESVDDDVGTSVATEVPESELEDGGPPDASLARLPWRGRDRLRVRFDPFVEQGCLQLSLTRAPPTGHCALA